MRFVALAIFLGVLAVIQVTINRQVATRWGLAPATLLNTAVATLAAGIFLGFAVALGRDPFLFQPGLRLSGLRWYWLLPGVIGFMLVAGLPWAVHHVGALRVFVGVVAAQMVASLAWDHFAESNPATPTRIGGALLAIASVVLVSWR
jgi:transporter family-2 protein